MLTCSRETMPSSSSSSSASISSSSSSTWTGRRLPLFGAFAFSGNSVVSSSSQGLRRALGGVGLASSSIGASVGRLGFPLSATASTASTPKSAAGSTARGRFNSTICGRLPPPSPGFPSGRRLSPPGLRSPGAPGLRGALELPPPAGRSSLRTGLLAGVGRGVPPPSGRGRPSSLEATSGRAGGLTGLGTSTGFAARGSVLAGAAPGAFEFPLFSVAIEAPEDFGNASREASPA